MAADYCEVEDIRTAFPSTTLDVSYDPLLTALVTRASRAIDRFTGREPGAYQVENDTTRYFTPRPNRTRANLYRNAVTDNTLGAYVPGGPNELWIGELATDPTLVSMALTGNLTQYTALAATNYLMWPYNAPAEGQPYRRIDLDLLNGTYRLWYQFPKAVKIVGKFGYSLTPPDEIVQATIIQAARWYKRATQGFADTGAIVELGQLRYTQKLDPDVALIIQHFRRLTV